MNQKPQSMNSPFAKPQTEFAKTIVGGAEVTWADGVVKVSFLPHYKTGQIENKFSNGQTVKTFPYNEFPFPVPQEAMNGTPIMDNLVVHLDKDADKVEQVTPYNWDGLSAKLVDFSRPNGKDTPPMWTEKPPYKDSSEPILEFAMYFEFTHSPLFKGKRVRQLQHYLFIDNGQGQAAWKFSVISPTQAYRGTWTQKLMDSMLMTGCVPQNWHEVGIATWPDDGNILPTLLERGLRANRTVKLNFKNGWIDSISLPSAFGGGDGGNVAETPAPAQPKQVNHSEDEM